MKNSVIGSFAQAIGELVTNVNRSINDRDLPRPDLDSYEQDTLVRSLVKGSDYGKLYELHRAKPKILGGGKQPLMPKRYELRDPLTQESILTITDPTLITPASEEEAQQIMSVPAADIYKNEDKVILRNDRTPDGYSIYVVDKTEQNSGRLSLKNFATGEPYERPISYAVELRKIISAEGLAAQNARSKWQWKQKKAASEQPDAPESADKEPAPQPPPVETPSPPQVEPESKPSQPAVKIEAGPPLVAANDSNPPTVVEIAAEKILGGQQSLSKLIALLARHTTAEEKRLAAIPNPDPAESVYVERMRALHGRLRGAFSESGVSSDALIEIAKELEAEIDTLQNEDLEGELFEPEGDDLTNSSLS